VRRGHEIIGVLLVGLILLIGWTVTTIADEDDALHDGGVRLEALQNNDGGWDWPLDDGDPNSTSPLNTIGPIAMGLARGYWNSGDPSFQAALSDTGALLLTKTNNFSPSDGYLATMLDSVFGGSTYRDHLQANFYGPLAAGTYDYKGSGTTYDTAGYVAKIRSDRAGLGNLAEWDLGMGLVGAAACGADTTAWIDGVKAELNEHDSNAWYDVIGLAGALYGLALVKEDFDPTAGDLASASDLDDLGDILAGYQIDGGGFAWNSNYVIPNDGNETVQETAYAILALNQLGRGTYFDVIQGAADWLVDFQLGTGGWKNWDGGGENNEVTGEAMWGIHAVYVEDLYVSSSGYDMAFGYGAIPFATISQAVSQMEGLGGEVHVAAGTYQEQVVIAGDMTLSGSPGAIILAPAIPGQFKIAESSKTWEPVIFVYGGTDDGSGNISGSAVSVVNLLGLIVDGNDRTPTQRSAGILLRNVEGTIAGNTVQNMNVDGHETFGIIVYGDSDVTIDGNSVIHFSRGGIGVMSGVATISNNVVVGPGLGIPVTWAPNGIQIGYGAEGTISGNEVSGCGWPGTAWSGTAIMVVDTSNVLVEGNYVHDNETGIGVTDFPEAAYGPSWAGIVSNITVQGNTLDSNEWPLAIVNEADNVLVLRNVFTNSVYDAIDVYSYDLYWPGLGIPYPSNVVIHYNSIEGSGGDGLWVMDGIGSPVDAILNWWGDVNGPSGEGPGAGDSVSTNAIFSPWLGTAPDGDPATPGVQITGPMLIIVDDIGPAPAGGYLNAAIAGANSADLPGHDTIEVHHGTYDASEPITDPVDIVSEPGSAAHTTLNGPISINIPDVLLGRLRQGFTINGPITVGSGIDASTIHINWNDIYDLVTNNGDNTLDATFNYWGDDGPDTVGLVAIYPYLPDPSDTIISYMDEHGLNAIEAIDFAKLLDLYLSAREALIGTELMETFGFTETEVRDIIDEYGAFLVDRALRLARGDYDEFMLQLVGYATGGGGGGGGALGGEGGTPTFSVGEPILLYLDLLNPITGEVVDDAVVSYTVTRTLADGTYEIVMFGVVPFSGDLEAYSLDLDTSTLEPGVYDVWLGTDDGRSYHYQVELTE